MQRMENGFLQTILLDHCCISDNPLFNPGTQRHGLKPWQAVEYFPSRLQSWLVFFLFSGNYPDGVRHGMRAVSGRHENVRWTRDWELLGSRHVPTRTVCLLDTQLALPTTVHISADGRDSHPLLVSFVSVWRVPHQRRIGIRHSSRIEWTNFHWNVWQLVLLNFGRNANSSLVWMDFSYSLNLQLNHSDGPNSPGVSQSWTSNNFQGKFWFCRERHNLHFCTLTEWTGYCQSQSRG